MTTSDSRPDRRLPLLSAFSPPLSLSPPFGLGFADGRTVSRTDRPTHCRRRRRRLAGVTKREGGSEG